MSRSRIRTKGVSDRRGPWLRSMDCPSKNQNALTRRYRYPSRGIRKPAPAGTPVVDVHPAPTPGSGRRALAAAGPSRPPRNGSAEHKVLVEESFRERRARRYRRSVKEGDGDKAEANEKFMDAVRTLPPGSHVAVLDTCRLSTTSRILSERPDFRVSIVEASRGECTRIRRSLAGARPRGGARVVHGDIFEKLCSGSLEGLDALWIDGMSPHVDGDALAAICTRNPGLRRFAVTVTMRDRGGRSFEDRMAEMSDALRSCAGLECKVAWGYRTGDAGCGMGLLVFGPRPLRRRKGLGPDHSRILFRPSSATPVPGPDGRPSGTYRVRWFGFRGTTTEGRRILKYIH